MYVILLLFLAGMLHETIERDADGKRLHKPLRHDASTMQLNEARPAVEALHGWQRVHLSISANRLV